MAADDQRCPTCSERGRLRVHRADPCAPVRRPAHRAAVDFCDLQTTTANCLVRHRRAAGGGAHPDQARCRRGYGASLSPASRAAESCRFDIVGLIEAYRSPVRRNGCPWVSDLRSLPRRTDRSGLRACRLGIGELGEVHRFTSRWSAEKLPPLTGWFLIPVPALIRPRQRITRVEHPGRSRLLARPTEPCW